MYRRPAVLAEAATSGTSFNPRLLEIDRDTVFLVPIELLDPLPL
jgi:hypothetical protein